AGFEDLGWDKGIRCFRQRANDILRRTEVVKCSVFIAHEPEDKRGFAGKHMVGFNTDSFLGGLNLHVKGFCAFWSFVGFGGGRTTRRHGRECSESAYG